MKTSSRTVKVGICTTRTPYLHIGMNNLRVLKCNMFCDNNSIHHIFVNLFQTISYQEISGNITLNYHGIPLMAFTHHNLIFLIHYSMKYE